MSSLSPDAAQLKIEVPHWAASISLRDNDLKPVAVTARVTPVDGSDYLGRLDMTVAPGAYEVEATIDGKSQRKWVLATADAPGVIHAREWDGLVIETAMPLPTAAPVHASSTVVAKVAARTPTPRALGQGARVSLFGTALRPPPESGEREIRSFEHDLTLIDADGATVPIGPPTGRNIVDRRWWRAAIDIAPGGYTLRSRTPPPRGGPESQEPVYRLQPLFLCAGFNHHLFFRCDGPPDLTTLTMHMTGLDQAYDPSQPAAIAADAVLTALVTGGARPLLTGSERLEQLLHGEVANPWLGVLAAYGLLDGPPEDGPNPLLNEILDHLQRVGLDAHPDVQVLMIAFRGASGPLFHPPMLLAALRRLQRLAVERTGLIAQDSLLARMGTRLLADTAWTAWIETPRPAAAAPPEPRPAPAADWGGEPEPAGAAPPAPSSLPPPIPAFAAFPDNAPVYPLISIDELPADQAVQGNVTLADHAAIIDAANSVVGAVCVPGQGCIDVKLDPNGNTLLDFTPDEVSRLTGVPLDLVVKDLDLLRNSQPGKADPASLERPMQLLAAAIVGKQTQAAAETANAPGRQSAAGSIESQARRLREEAGRLRKLVGAAGPDDSEIEEIARLGDGFDGFADNLVKRAHLVILADDQHRLRYGNRLLRDRLEVREEGATAVLERMTQVLAGLSEDFAIINAAELSPTSPEGRAGSDVEITRRRLHDGTREIGAIYLLRDLSLPELTAEQADLLDALLPQLSLTGSLLEFAEGQDRTRHLNRLVALADQIGLLLSQPYMQGEIDRMAAHEAIA